MRRLYLCGGFLGSGKTTAICQAAGVLSARKYRVALITNDQGVRLVDGALARGMGLSATEIGGGCFCCRYEELESALRTLDHDHGPSIIFAEAVGSCTDMVATVVKPLAERYPSLKVSLTVFLDARIVAAAAAGRLPYSDPDLNYIYFSQPAEADLVVVSKADLVTRAQLAEVRGFMEARYPGRTLLFQNSLSPEGVGGWLRALGGQGAPASRQSLQVDYDSYAAGEAAMAWLDEELEITSGEGAAVAAATRLVNTIFRAVREEGYPIGHLKFLLSAGDWQRKISFTSPADPVVRETEGLPGVARAGLLINARVQCGAPELGRIVADAERRVEAGGDIRCQTRGAEAFSPGYPRPTHRMA